MKNYLSIALTLFLCTVVYILASGRQLPTDFANKLAAVQADFAKQADKADVLRQRAETDLDAIKKIRQMSAPSLATENDIAGTNFLMGLDGMTIFLQLFAVEAGLNRDSLKILAGVAQNILAGEKYKKLDAALQELETTHASRETGLKGLEKQFEQVTAVIQHSRQGNNDSKQLAALEAIDSFLVAQRLNNGILLDQFEEGIKPGTQALRENVDRLAKNGW